jgi:capsular polysaccharide biosynthesis protein
MLQSATSGKKLASKIFVPKEGKVLGVQINSQNKISDEIRKRIQAGNRYYYAGEKLL